MNSRATLGLTAGALALGLVAGLALGSDEHENAKPTGPGPTKTVGGVPVGYTQSREGAIQAALSFESVLARLPKMPPESRSDALAAIASGPNKEVILDAANQSLAFFDQSFGESGVVRSAVVGYRVAAFEPQKADIELWEVNVVGRPDTVPARSAWGTRLLSLVWDGDWKLAKPPVDSAGPTPALDGTVSESSAVISVARELSDVRYAPLQ